MGFPFEQAEGLPHQASHDHACIGRGRGFRLSIAPLLLLVLAGCGYIGEPLPPLANVPARVNDVSAVQRGSQLVLRFTVPTLTTEGMPIRPPLDLDLRVGPASEPFEQAAWAQTATKFATEGRIANGVAELTVPASAWAGKTVAVGVQAIGRNGKESGWNVAMFPVVAPLAAPAAVTTQNTAEGVRLSWTGAGDTFRILRRVDGQDFTQIAEVPVSPWVDKTSQFGQTYTYKIQALEKLPGDRAAESEISSEATVTPRDEFPPAVPSGLRAAGTPQSMELSWAADTDADLAGYIVYRSVDNGPMQKLAQVDVPAYSDRDVQPGKVYRYEVSAFDQTANESAHSTAVEARAP